MVTADLTFRDAIWKPRRFDPCIAAGLPVGKAALAGVVRIVDQVAVQCGRICREIRRRGCSDDERIVRVFHLLA